LLYDFDCDNFNIYMLNLPKQCIIFDTEFTTWEGAMERGWSGPGEYEEIVQIGSILVDTETFEEKEHLLLFVKPVKNPKLSDYFIEITGITQGEVDQYGTTLATALKTLQEFAGNNHFYSFGGDENVIQKNCDLLGIPFPLEKSRFHDIRDTFEAFGISTHGYMSSTIPEAFDEKPKRTGHDGLNDARTMLEGLRLLYKSQRMC